MKIQTKQNKPHRQQMTVAHEFAVSYTLIESGVTIVYIKEEFKSIREEFKYTN